MHWWKKGHFGGVPCDFRWVPGDFSLEKNVIFPKICFKTCSFEKNLRPKTKNFDFWALYGPQRKKYTKRVIFGFFRVKSHFWVMGRVSRPKKKIFSKFLVSREFLNKKIKLFDKKKKNFPLGVRVVLWQLRGGPPTGGGQRGGVLVWIFPLGWVRGRKPKFFGGKWREISEEWRPAKFFSGSTILVTGGGPGWSGAFFAVFLAFSTFCTSFFVWPPSGLWHRFPHLADQSRRSWHHRPGFFFGFCEEA